MSYFDFLQNIISIIPKYFSVDCFGMFPVQDCFICQLPWGGEMIKK